jgi:putative hydrolase of HD superfamily
METIKGMLEGNAFGQEALDLWLEYAADSSAEAQFVKDADKLELIIQACEYERGMLHCLIEKGYVSFQY